jgi:DNA-binding NtrC family response regulator
VHVGPIMRAQENASGRELEFIVRSLLELKLQVEELRGRMDDERPAVRGERWIGDLHPTGAPVAAIEPRDQAPPPNTLTISVGTKMADIERTAIEMALRETRGNRKRAADMLGIGERTLYRKIKEYRLPEVLYASDGSEG